MEIFGIKFAPLNVSLKRRLETLAVTVYLSCIFLLLITGYPLLIYLFFYSEILRYFVLLYLFWMYYDNYSYNVGGKRYLITTLVTSVRKNNIYIISSFIIISIRVIEAFGRKNECNLDIFVRNFCRLS